MQRYVTLRQLLHRSYSKMLIRTSRNTSRKFIEIHKKIDVISTIYVNY